MGSPFGRQSLRGFWRSACFCLILAALVVGGGCKSRKAKPVKVIYINRRPALGQYEQQALAMARAEVEKWDTGLVVTDHRVQRHSGGWIVSLLLSSGTNEAGEATYPEQPIRNVEINRSMEVLGYHASQ